jgi:hypothetical protein
MTRDEARERMIDYLEGTLAPGDARAVADLLATDAVLAGEATARRATLDALHGPADPPPGYHDLLAGRIVARMEEAGIVFGVPPRRPIADRVFGWAVPLRPMRVLAAAVLVLILGIGARVVLERGTGGGAPIGHGEAAEAVGLDALTPPDEALAALTDAQTAAVADGLAEAVASDLAADLAARETALIEDDSDEGAVVAAIAELDDAGLAALADELGKELSLPL